MNKIPYLLPPLKGKDMHTAQRLSVPCRGDTMRRATECVSDRDVEQSAKCRITKSSLETVKCRPMWGQGLLVRYWNCTGDATAVTVVTALLSDFLMVCLPDFMWEGSEKCDLQFAVTTG